MCSWRDFLFGIRFSIPPLLQSCPASVKFFMLTEWTARRWSLCAFEKIKIQKWQHCLNLNFYGLNKSLEYLLISIGASLNIKTSSLEFKQSDFQFSSVQSLSPVRLFVTPWIAACQASLSITISWNSLKLTSIESVMPSHHLILCHPLLLPPIPPSIRVFSNESTIHTRWPKYWSFSFSISPSKEHPGLISFRMDWLDLFDRWRIFLNSLSNQFQSFWICYGKILHKELEGKMYFLKFCFSQFLGIITFVIKVVNFFSRIFSIYSMLKKFQCVCGKYFP